MDIDLPGINGMEAAQILRGYDEQTPLVFVTNLAQYAIKGYQVDALDFMVKPVAYDDFSLRMDRAMRMVRRTSKGTVAIPTPDGIRVVRLDDVLYVDIVKHDLHYTLPGSQPPAGARHHHQGCGGACREGLPQDCRQLRHQHGPGGADTGDLGGHVGRHGAVL